MVYGKTTVFDAVTLLVGNQAAEDYSSNLHRRGKLQVNPC